MLDAWSRSVTAAEQFGRDLRPRNRETPARSRRASPGGPARATEIHGASPHREPPSKLLTADRRKEVFAFARFPEERKQFKFMPPPQQPSTQTTVKPELRREIDG